MACKGESFALNYKVEKNELCDDMKWGELRAQLKGGKNELCEAFKSFKLEADYSWTVTWVFECTRFLKPL